MAWSEARHTRLEGEVAGLLPRASDLAQQLAVEGWRRVSSLFAPADEASLAGHCWAGRGRAVVAVGCALLGVHESGPACSSPGHLDRPRPATSQLGSSPPTDAAAQGGVPRVPAPLPQPAGSLQLTVGRVTLGGPPSTADCFLVLKCGPHWGRSQPLPMAGAPLRRCTEAGCPGCCWAAWAARSCLAACADSPPPCSWRCALLASLLSAGPAPAARRPAARRPVQRGVRVAAVAAPAGPLLRAHARRLPAVARQAGQGPRRHPAAQRRAGALLAAVRRRAGRLRHVCARRACMADSGRRPHTSLLLPHQHLHTHDRRWASCACACPACGPTRRCRRSCRCWGSGPRARAWRAPCTSACRPRTPAR